MPPILLYTSDHCPYCVRAKQLLAKKGAAFTEIDVTHDEARRAEMVARAGGRRSVPQIFIGDTHIGGCDDLYALEREGKLAGMLG